MRKIIAVLQISVDGYIEGPNGDIEWSMEESEEIWKNLDEMLKSVDTCILGRVMYPEYEQYWLAILANPEAVLPFSGKLPTKNEITYAKWADKIPHIVLSKTLDKANWKTTQIVQDVEEIRKIKQQPGKNIFAIGGATLVSSLINAGLLDELRLTIHPLILGGGKALFKDVKKEHALKLTHVKQLESSRVNLIYRM